jgi:hypothetical protein
MRWLRPHLPFAPRRSGNSIALWPMSMSQRAGITGMSGDGG